MFDWISIPEAARAMGVSPGRVRAMVADGQLAATKVGGRWIIQRSAVDERLRIGSASGRPFSPVGAWALLLLTSGEPVDAISSQQRSRLRRALALEGLENLAVRLRGRADLLTYRTHPGEIPYVLDDPRLVRTGISAASDHSLGLQSGTEADGYLCTDQLDDFVEDHAQSPAGADGNTRLRLVQPEAWSLIGEHRTAPLAAVALDLSQSPDPRLAQVGSKLISELGTRRAERLAG